MNLGQKAGSDLDGRAVSVADGRTCAGLWEILLLFIHSRWYKIAQRHAMVIMQAQKNAALLHHSEKKFVCDCPKFEGICAIEANFAEITVILQ
ncbi:MAG: hypothetical protein AAF601_03575 [Pseudomonadota bacterium]